MKKKIFTLLPWVLSAGYVFVLAVELTPISQGFCFSWMREVDEYGFLSIIRGIHEDALQGRWLKVFDHPDFGYGAIFWLLEALWSAPLRLLGSEATQLIGLRGMSLLLGLIGAFFFSDVAVILSRRKSLRGWFFWLSISVGAFPFATLRVHNISLLFFLFALSLWLLIRKTEGISKDNRKWAFVAGLGCGVKLTGLFFLPVLVPLWLFGSSRISLREFAKVLGTGAFGFVFAACPLFALYPFTYPQIRHWHSEWRHQLARVATSMDLPEPQSIIRHAIEPNYYSLWILGTILALSVFFVWRKKSKLKENIIPWVVSTCGFLMVLSYLIFRSRQGPSYVISYLFATGLVPFLVLARASRGSRVALVLVTALIVINAQQQRIAWHGSARMYSQRETTSRFVRARAVYSKLKEHPDFKNENPLNVVRSESAVLPRCIHQGGLSEQVLWGGEKISLDRSIDWLILDERWSDFVESLRKDRRYRIEVETDGMVGFRKN